MGWSKCGTVSVTIKGDVAKVLDDVKKLAAGNDMDVKGDLKSGTIQHRKVDVRGTYTITDKTVKITMEEAIVIAKLA